MANRGREVIVILAVIAFGIVLVFMSEPERCNNIECFQKNLIECKESTYVNEENVASWGYNIKGLKNRDCEIEVTLLVAKEGELGIDKFEGDTMLCLHAKGVVVSPEKDLNRCSGKLKEDLQEILIERLHRYILDNLGEIQDELKRL